MKFAKEYMDSVLLNEASADKLDRALEDLKRDVNVIFNRPKYDALMRRDKDLVKAFNDLLALLSEKEKGGSETPEADGADEADAAEPKGEEMEEMNEAEGGDYPIDPDFAESLASDAMELINAALDPKSTGRSKYSDMMLGDVVALLRFYSHIRSWATEARRNPKRAKAYWNKVVEVFDDLDATGMTRALPKPLVDAVGFQ